MMARMPGAADEIEKGLDTAALRRAWKFAGPYHLPLVLNLVTLAVATAIAATPPLIFRKLIDTAIPHHNYGLVNWLFIAAIAIAFANTGLGLLNRWFSSWIGEGLIFDLRVALYEHIQRMPIGFFTRTQTGSVLSRIGNDVVGAQSTITTASTVASDLLTLGVTLTAMLALSWQVTVLALIVVPFFILLDRRLGKRLAVYARKQMVSNAEMTTIVQERSNVSGALLVKLFGRHDDEVKLFRGHANSVRENGIKMALTSRFYYGALALAGSLGTALVYWLGSRSVIHGGLTIGTLTALAAYVTRLYDPLTSLASARVDLLTALVSFDRCFEVLDAPVAINDAPDAVDLPKETKGTIKFDDVWFRYPAPSSVSVKSLETVVTTEHDDEPSDWILKGITFEARPGSTVALVGPSGAGKTTLSGLIPRLYDVDKGSITIDGFDVRSVRQESLRDAIGVVSQDTHLFHDTVAANLRYAKPGASDSDIIEACKGARIHEMIASLPQGYDTVVGERGYRLSGGEKQRLAIARVLLKQPAIVILDEATAHLDSDTEALVQQALAEALSGRTAVVIAHRLSTIRAASQILVIEHGEVIERGTHSELVTTDGLYAMLYATQYATTESGFQ